LSTSTTITMTERTSGWRRKHPEVVRLGEIPAEIAER
jgi:hypothetical protein